jgi:hypothetical protein
MAGPHNVTSSPLRHLVAGLVAFSSPGFAAGSDAPQSTIAKLAQTGEVACQPSLPFFCSNMHVSCSGQTAIETFPFKLKASAHLGTIDSAPDTEGLRTQYQNGRVEWDKEGTYVVLFPRLAGGYIKLQADGTYSLRHYVRNIGVMSTGRCH